MVKMPWTGIFVDVFVSFYGEDVPIKELSNCVAHYSHLCTLYWWLRFSLHPQPQILLMNPKMVPFQMTLHVIDTKCKLTLIGCGLLYLDVIMISWSNLEVVWFCNLKVQSFVHGCRPFGSSSIIRGYDMDGPQLYTIDPSGVAYVMLIFFYQPSFFLVVF